MNSSRDFPSRSPDQESRYPVWDSMNGSSYPAWLLELARWYETDIQIGMGSGIRPDPSHLLSVLNEEDRHSAVEMFSLINTFYRMGPVKQSQLPSTIAGLGADATSESKGSKEFLLRAADAASSDSNNGEFPHVVGFEFIKLLGQGGMGVVYLARQIALDRLVAIKMVASRVRSQDDFLRRFDAEAQAAAKLVHENIVNVYDFEASGRRPYICFEYVDGGSLHDKLDDGPLESREAVKLLLPIVNAIAFAHSQGILHRDLKPGNVLLTSNGIPKLSDFGLAKDLELDRELSISGEIIGTPQYMSPEQAQGDALVGTSADIYSLGAILYLMVTGKAPFVGHNQNDTLLKLINDPPLSPRSIRSEISIDLETIILKCLNKAPSDRYASATELADDLQRFLSGEPILARPYTTAEKVFRWAKRKPTLAALSGTALLLGFVLAIGGPISAMAIFQQKQIAESESIAAENARKDAELQALKAKENEEIAARNADTALVQQKNAIDALKSLVFEVQRKMEDEPKLLALRKELLKVASDGLNRMEQTGSDPVARNIIAAAIERRLGDVNLEVGRIVQAETHYRACLEILLSLDAENKLTGKRHNLSSAYELLASSLRHQGRNEEALKYLTKCLSERRAWVQEEPGNSAVLSNLASTLGVTGNVLQKMGNLDQAHDYLVESFDVRRLLAEQNPSSLAAELDVLGARLSLVKLEFQREDFQFAIPTMREINSKFLSIANAHPDNLVYQQNSILSAKELAKMLVYQGQFDEALSVSVPALEKALELRHAFPPDSKAYIERVGSTSYTVAVAYESVGKSEEADAAFQRHYDCFTKLHAMDPDNELYQASVLLAAARIDRLKEYSALMRKFLEADAKSDMRYSIACMFAQASQSLKRNPKQLDFVGTAELIQKAKALLEKLIDDGFHREGDLRHDPDLAPLRSQD